MREIAHWTAIVSLIALIFLCLLWEAWLAPLRPGGSLLMLKALPLLIPLFGILRGKVYTYQWTALLVLAYSHRGAGAGLVRARVLRSSLALLETGLAVVLLASCVIYVRLSRPARAAA